MNDRSAPSWAPENAAGKASCAARAKAAATPDAQEMLPPSSSVRCTSKSWRGNLDSRGRARNCSSLARVAAVALDRACATTSVRLPSHRSPPISLPYRDSSPHEVEHVVLDLERGAEQEAER